MSEKPPQMSTDDDSEKKEPTPAPAPERIPVQDEEREQLSFSAGTAVILTKQFLDPEQSSKVAEGQSLEGALLSDIRVGSPIYLDSGSRTSPVLNISYIGGKTFVDTRTSRYVIESTGEGQSDDVVSGIEKEEGPAPVKVERGILDENLQGLEFENHFGSVHLPKDAKIAELKEEIIDIPFRRPSDDRDLSFYINKEKLQGTLLEVNGGQLFRTVEGRFTVVTKVGNGHLPFYISSAGTSGKKVGEWYPFFGYTGDWFVKGGVNEAGEMEYSDEISEVQNILNENLRFPAGFISPYGKFGTYRHDTRNNFEPSTVYADINTMLKYQNYLIQENQQDGIEDEREYVKRITGYDPEKVKNDGGGSSMKWIYDVVIGLSEFRG